ncbi:MAG: hypothetical protein ABIO65_08715 [Nitrospiria bacterium]
MISSTRFGWSVLAVIAVLSLGPSVSSAGTPTFEGLAGWEGDGWSQGYGFVGAGALQPIGPGLTLVTRVSASYLSYAFESEGVTTSVRSPGLSAMTGLRRGLAGGTIAVLGGYETRWEERRIGEGRGATGVTGGGVLQADADVGLGRRWRGFLFGNYAQAGRYLFSRTALRWQATNREWVDPVAFFLGIEGIRQGNDDSAALQAGPFVEWSVVPIRISVTLRGGYKDRWSPNGPHHRGAYGGVGLYHRF